MATTRKRSKRSSTKKGDTVTITIDRRTAKQLVKATASITAWIAYMGALCFLTTPKRPPRKLPPRAPRPRPTSKKGT